MGDYAEARKKLIAKIENCEVIHEHMKKELLIKRGVNAENYYRLNVEVGVGEFGMNEWHRLSDISTSTRRYLSRPDEQRMIQGSSTKLAKIHRAKERWTRMSNVPEIVSPSLKSDSMQYPLAVELPGDFPPPRPVQTPSSRESFDSGIDRLSLPGSVPPFTPSPRSSQEKVRPLTSHSSPPQQTARLHQPASASPLVSATKPPADDPDRLVVTAPTPAQYRNGSGTDKIVIMSPDEHPRRHHTMPVSQEGPPRPPKTPLPEEIKEMGGLRPSSLPYPDDDEPPPTVNMAKKPNYRVR